MNTDKWGTWIGGDIVTDGKQRGYVLDETEDHTVVRWENLTQTEVPTATLRPSELTRTEIDALVIRYGDGTERYHPSPASDPRGYANASR